MRQEKFYRLENKNTELEETRFELDLNEEHYYILALEGGRTNINKTKITVSDFNRKFYNIKAGVLKV